MGAEEAMLREALGDELRGSLKVLSREPYGDGAMTGFAEHGEGEQTRYWYVDTSGRPVQAETGFVLGDPEHPQARIWLHPADPRLPAMAPASFPDAAATLMGRLGIGLDQPPELLVYRPGKRAMFRMRSGARETYLKIVRPEASASIVQLQEALRAGGVPVPLITGWSELGIVLTESAAGVPLTARLDAIDAERLLDAIEALRASFAEVDTGQKARDSLARRHRWYFERIDAALQRQPELGAILTEPVAALTAMVQSVDASALEIDADVLRTVHGDLHVGQLFVGDADPSTIAGVIDIDTCGLGDPADDEAALMGHLVASIVLAGEDEVRSAGLRRLLDTAARRWLSIGRPGRCRVAHRTAVHVLAHALPAIEQGDEPTASALLALGRALLEPVLATDPTPSSDATRPD